MSPNSTLDSHQIYQTCVGFIILPLSICIASVSRRGMVGLCQLKSHVGQMLVILERESFV